MNPDHNEIAAIAVPVAVAEAISVILFIAMLGVWAAIFSGA